MCLGTCIAIFVGTCIFIDFVRTPLRCGDALAGQTLKGPFVGLDLISWLSLKSGLG